MGLKETLRRLQQLTREAEAAGGADRVKKQRAQGRMTARERVEALLDRGSVVEIDKFKKHRITDFDIAEKKTPRASLRDGLRNYGRPPGLHFQPRFHRLRRQPVGRLRREGLQGDGPRREN